MLKDAELRRLSIEKENVSIFKQSSLIKNKLNSVFDFHYTTQRLKSYFFVGAPKRILSSSREKIEYSSKFPNALKSIIQESKGDIEVSKVRSKKFYELCSKFAKKVNN